MEKTDTWAAFGSEYIKAIDVLKSTDEYAIVGVESREEKGKDVLHLNLERGDLKKVFGCNKTNTYAVQAECINSPKDSIGRIITFNKVKVQRPGTDEIVDGLRLKFKPIEVIEPSEVDTDNAGLDENNQM